MITSFTKSNETESIIRSASVWK